MFEKIREKLMGSDTNSQKNTTPEEEASTPAPEGNSAYKCSQCGKTPLSGPVLYCEGCGQYMCYTCGVPSGDMIWNCPNCAIQADRVVL